MGNVLSITYKTDFGAKKQTLLLPVRSQNYVDSITEAWFWKDRET